MIDTIICGDCLPLMCDITENSIDMVLCDLPYGVTENRWDKGIDLSALWTHYMQVIKPSGAIVLTAVQPFTSMLVMSNLQWFRHEWIWRKNKASNFLNAKTAPLRNHESILVFARKAPRYWPVKSEGHKAMHFTKQAAASECYGKFNGSVTEAGKTWRYPKSVIGFDVVNNVSKDRVHPNQKPVELFEYLIRTYTNEGDLVLDNCIGSGTTAVAAIRTGRHYIGMDSSEEYCELTRKRIRQERSQLKLDLLLP